MRLVQFIDEAGDRRVGLVEDAERLRLLRDVRSTYELAQRALKSSEDLPRTVDRFLGNETASYESVYERNRLLPPFDHPDPSHCFVSGTGLNHYGSALARDAMHAGDDEAKPTDSMMMFRWGVEGGKPDNDSVGAQPEWFYKGNGEIVVAPGHPLELPAFALDGGEEAEVAGVYLIGDQGEVYRVGYTLGNEFSDHSLERQNYLYLAHSKLRTCSFGPELLLDDLPSEVSGDVRILRHGKTVWTKTFDTGEANMTHSLRNLEHHHFKYRLFRHPGDVHFHFLGASTLSCADQVTVQPGDVFEISSPLWMRPLRNPLQRESAKEVLTPVRPLYR